MVTFKVIIMDPLVAGMMIEEKKSPESGKFLLRGLPLPLFTENVYRDRVSTFDTLVGDRLEVVKMCYRG